MSETLPICLYLSSKPMGDEYGSIAQMYIDHLAKSWEGKRHLVPAKQAFEDANCGRNFTKYIQWVVAEHYGSWRFDEFVVPAEDTVLDAMMEKDDPRRNKPHHNGINRVSVDEEGRTYVRVGQATGPIVRAALATDRPVKVIGNGFKAAMPVTDVEEGEETYITSRGRERKLKIFRLYFGD